MKCKDAGGANAVFGIFNTIFFACGFIEVTCGFLLLCDTERVLLSRLLAAPDAAPAQPPFHYLALALLAAGLAVCAVAALGCWATYAPGYVILTIYFLLVLGLLVCGCAGGAAAALWPCCAGLQGAAGGAAGALRSYYALPDYEPFTAAVDLAQTELECCGMSGARDYDMSVWQLRRLGPRGMAVPPSCCVQPRARRSHLNPAPANHSRCQEAAPDPAYRYVPGCLGKLQEWYQQQYRVFMLSLCAAALLELAALLSAVFSCTRLRARRPRPPRSPRPPRYSGNVYESNVGAPQDEPIMAKYVQPNNFYSPRVRNPKIFPSKPNEMV